MSINKVILVGRVGKDAEIKTFDNGGKIATFSLATSYKTKDKKEITTWHNLVLRNNSAENISKYIKKGLLLYCEGMIVNRSYESKDGKKYITEIYVDKVEFLSKNENDSKSGEELITPTPNVNHPEDYDLPF